MPEHDPGEYGRHIAGDYDEIYGGAFDTEEAVVRLVELAAGGPVLEFGIGTGRLAIPLAERGLAVHGVDGSEQMLQRLHEKPGGERVHTTLGDFAEVRLEPPAQFPLVILAVNTIFALENQEAQVRCFATAEYHLREDGRFEAWVPEALPPGQSLRPRNLSPGFIGIVAADHDPVTQTLSTTQIVLGGPLGVRVFPVVHRYAWPSELDLMARLAGLTLESRWADWHQTPFGPTSTNHISVYRRLEVRRSDALALTSEIGGVSDMGGDPACWLHRVCDVCGGVIDAEDCSTCAWRSQPEQERVRDRRPHHHISRRVDHRHLKQPLAARYTRHTAGFFNHPSQVADTDPRS